MEASNAVINFGSNMVSFFDEQIRMHKVGDGHFAVEVICEKEDVPYNHKAQNHEKLTAPFESENGDAESSCLPVVVEHPRNRSDMLTLKQKLQRRELSGFLEVTHK